MGCGASNNAAVSTTSTTSRNGTSASASASAASTNRSTVAVSVAQQQQNSNNNSRNSSTPLVARPLMMSPNYRHGGNITQAELDRQRAEFWSTRTEGSRLMWQSIRTAADALVSNDLPLAGAILEASNVMTPTGTLEVCYDERGAQYKVPIYCYANPIELRGENPLAAASAKNIPTAVTISGSVPTAVNAKPLKLKIRVNPGDINLMVSADTGFSIGQLKRTIVEESQQAAVPIPDMEEQRQRIIFMGRELQNPQLLSEVGFDEQKVVQVFLRPKT